MNMQESKEKFIEAWGTLGTNWGISRTMAQVHALLLASFEPLSTEQIMESLQISRGNANMNIRALLDWGLIQKSLKTGDRKEYFLAEKDIWKISKLIARERRKRELEPALKILTELKTMPANTPEETEFKKQISEIYDFTNMTDGLLEKFMQSNNTWFMKLVAAMMT